MYLNVWLPYSVVLAVSIGLVVALAIWKIVIAVLKTIPFV